MAPFQRERETCSLPFAHVTFYAYDTPRQGQGRAKREEGGSVLHTGIACVTPRKVRRESLLGSVSGLLRLCCAASVYPSGGVGAGRKAHQSSSFSCVTIPS